MGLHDHDNIVIGFTSTHIIIQYLSQLNLSFKLPHVLRVYSTATHCKVNLIQMLWDKKNYGLLFFSTNKNDCYNITEILLKVALNTITLTPIYELMQKYLLYPPPCRRDTGFTMSFRPSVYKSYAVR